MLPEARSIQQSNYPENRRSPEATIQFRAKVRELYLAGKTTVKEIADITGKSKGSVREYLRVLGNDPNSGVNYSHIANPKGEDSKWYKIMERTLQELPFYERQGLVPSARKMGYRLIEISIAEKKSGKSDEDLFTLGLPVLPDPNDKEAYSKAKVAFLNEFYGKSAEARRGVDYTYTKSSILPKLPIDCFVDELRETIGNTDIDEAPQDPTPATPPKDPGDYIHSRIHELRMAPDWYSGRCTPGSLRRSSGLLVWTRNLL